MEDHGSEDTQTNKEEPPTKTSDEEHKSPPMDALEKSVEKKNQNRNRMNLRSQRNGKT